MALLLSIILTSLIERSQSSKSIKIGGAFALTGFASTWGEADRNGSLLAIEDMESEGVFVSLKIEDTHSDNIKTLSAIKKLLNIDKVDVILGPTWMDSFGSATPISEQEDVVILSPSASITAVEAEKNYPNVFSTWYRSDAELQRFPEYMRKEGYFTIAVIITNDSFWEDVLTNLKIGAEESGLDIIDVLRVNPNDYDLRTQISKLKLLNPDAIFFGFNSEENLRGFLNQKQTLYPDAKILTTESIEEFIAYDEFNASIEGVIYIAPKILNSEFNIRYKERFGDEPIFSASNSYDATNILIEALQNTNGETNEIRNYLNNRTFDTVTFGKITFDEIGGIVGGDFVIKSIENGEIIIMDAL